MPRQGWLQFWSQVLLNCLRGSPRASRHRHFTRNNARPIWASETLRWGIPTRRGARPASPRADCACSDAAAIGAELVPNKETTAPGFPRAGPDRFRHRRSGKDRPGVHDRSDLSEPGQLGLTTCSNFLGINDSGSGAYNPPISPAFLAGLGAGLLTVFGARRALSLPSRALTADQSS